MNFLKHVLALSLILVMPVTAGSESYYGETIDSWLDPDRSARIDAAMLKFKRSLFEGRKLDKKTADKFASLLEEPPADQPFLVNFRISGRKSPELIKFEELFRVTATLFHSENKNKRHIYMRRLVELGFPFNERAMLNHAFMTGFDRRFNLKVASMERAHLEDGITSDIDLDFNRELINWTHETLDLFSEQGKLALVRLTLEEIIPGYYKFNSAYARLQEETPRLDEAAGKSSVPHRLTLHDWTGGVEAVLEKFQGFNEWYDAHTFALSVTQACGHKNGKGFIVGTTQLDLSTPSQHSGGVTGILLRRLFLYEARVEVKVPTKGYSWNQNGYNLQGSKTATIEREVGNLPAGTYITEGKYNLNVIQRITGTLGITVEVLEGFTFEVSIPTINMATKSTHVLSKPCTYDSKGNIVTASTGGSNGGGGSDGGRGEVDDGGCMNCLPGQVCQNGACITDMDGCITGCPTGMECMFGQCVQVSVGEPMFKSGSGGNFNPSRGMENIYRLENGATLVFDINRNLTLDGTAEVLVGIHDQNGVTPNAKVALSLFDKPKFGGNQNGSIDPDDLIWAKLFSVDIGDKVGPFIPLEEAGISRIEF
ncbi:MAG: EB domain-containing protein [Acidobacteriota bacterium]|nr:EB domain-containing protein [Acidobacteriota bacterium]